MIKFKKNSFYHFFSLLVIFILLYRRIIEANYPPREPQLFNEYLQFNILPYAVLLFLVAYLIPLLISLKLKKRVALILIVGCFGIMVGYAAVSFYLFFFGSQPATLPQNVGNISSLLVGFVLGIGFAGLDQILL